VVGSSIRGYHSTRGVGKQSFTYNCAMSINGFFCCCDYKCYILNELRWIVNSCMKWQCDCVTYAKAKANVMIVFKVIWKPIWLGCFR
jgi:hypothetical protein